MQPIVPSRELIRRTIETEVAYTLSRMNVLARLDGNPVGIAHREVGHGWALMARHLPVPGFNAVIGLEAGDAGELEALLQWYRDNDVRPQIEIVPGHEDAALTRELTRLRLSPFGIPCVDDRAARAMRSRRTRDRCRARDGRCGVRGFPRRLYRGPRTPRRCRLQAQRASVAHGAWMVAVPRARRRRAGGGRGSLLCARASAIWPMPRPIRRFAGADCRPRCWRIACATRRSRAQATSRPARRSSQARIATWCAPG